MTFTCPKCNMERTSLDCVPCLAQKLTDAYVEQKKRADEAVALLTAIDWFVRADGFFACACCGAMGTHPEPRVHRDNCELAALIGKAGA